jgi:hypothetical protein
MAEDLLWGRALREGPEEKKLKSYYFESLKFFNGEPMDVQLPEAVFQQLSEGQVAVATAYWFPFNDPEGSLYVDMSVLNPDLPLVDNEFVSIKKELSGLCRITPNIQVMCDAQLAAFALENRLLKHLGRKSPERLPEYSQLWPEFPGDLIVANSPEFNWMYSEKLVSLEALWGLKR